MTFKMPWSVRSMVATGAVLSVIAMPTELGAQPHCGDAASPRCDCPTGSRISGVKISMPQFKAQSASGERLDIAREAFEAYLGTQPGGIAVVGERKRKIAFCWQDEVVWARKQVFRWSGAGGCPANYRHYCQSIDLAEPSTPTMGGSRFGLDNNQWTLIKRCCDQGRAP